MVTGVIYKYTSPDGGIYIGLTLDECQRRGYFFLAKNYAGSKIDEARRKYGPENFTYERLVHKLYINKIIALEELNKLEAYYINKYNSVECGYNSKIGNYDKDKKVMGYNPNRKYKSYNYKVKFQKSEQNAKGKKPVLQYDLYGNFIARYKSIGEAGRITHIDPSNISRCCQRKSLRVRNFIFRFE